MEWVHQILELEVALDRKPSVLAIRDPPGWSRSERRWPCHAAEVSEFRILENQLV